MDEIEAEFEEWKPLLQALLELRQLREENKILKMMNLTYAEESLEDIDSWGCYADQYFQKKWDYEGTLNKWKRRIKVLSVEQKIVNVSQALEELTKQNEILQNQVRALSSLIREQNCTYAQH